MNIGGPVLSGLRPHILVGSQSKPMNISFETDEYNLNIFIGIDEFKNSDE
jgi:hypothetical protein